MNEHDLRGCVTMEELARLFDDAFAMWQARVPDPEGCRRSPRIPTGQGKAIFIVSCAHDGRETVLNHRAMLVDVSADGLGMVFPDPLPIGADLHFAFDSEAGERNNGVASVVSAREHADGYRIGLIFADTAQSLDVGLTAGEVTARLLWTRWWRSIYARLKQAAAVAARVTTRRDSAHREVSRRVDGKDASFVVDAKLFRYTASIIVNGRKIVSRSGVLRDRARILFSETARPTTVHLEGGGCSAWATVRANAVTHCTLGATP